MTDIPDLCEPILGWRYWRVELGYLVSGNSDMGSEVLWPPYQRLVAQHYQFHGFDPTLEDVRRTACRMAGPPCPEHYPRNMPGCGLYAATEEMLLREFSTGSLMGSAAIAIGRVALWGRVAVHAEGWRGQYAYPHELVYVTENVDGPALAATYGISLKENESWKLVMKNGALLQSRSYLLSLPHEHAPSDRPPCEDPVPEYPAPVPA